MRGRGYYSPGALIGAGLTVFLLLILIGPYVVAAFVLAGLVLVLGEVRLAFVTWRRRRYWTTRWSAPRLYNMHPDAPTRRWNHREDR